MSQILSDLSDAESRALWETSTDAIVILDRASDVRYANPAVAEIFGYKPEEIVGQNVAIIQPERLREAHRQGLGRFLANRCQESELESGGGSWAAS